MTGSAHPAGDLVATPAPFTELTARRLGPVRRYFVRRPVAMDVLVMVVFFLPTFLTLVLAGTEPDPAPPTAVYLALLAAGTATLYWRRRAPLIATAVLVGLFVTSVLATGETLGYELALGFVMYAVAASRPTWLSWAVLAGMVTVTFGAVALSANSTVRVQAADGENLELDERTSTIVGIAIFLLVALAIGISVRNRRLHVAELVERANALSRDREQHAQIARAAERSRIAREMHDVVAHSLSVMIALADGAGAALERSPDSARLALTELSDTGRSALTDMRRVLGVLDTDAPLEPPGSHDLGELVERFRAAGLPVRLEGLTTELPPDTGLALAVYRIIQEALTNALRYAQGTSSVEVRVSRDPDSVRVEVVDHGTHLEVGDSGGAGRGLIGMAERAAIYGGTVDAGPWNAGWRVRAELPWKDAEA